MTVIDRHVPLLIARGSHAARPGSLLPHGEDRQLLRDFVDQYETEHGEMTGAEDVELPAGRRMGQ